MKGYAQKSRWNHNGSRGRFMKVDHTKKPPIVKVPPGTNPEEMRILITPTIDDLKEKVTND